MKTRFIMPFLAIIAVLTLVFGSTAAGIGQAEKAEKDKKPDPFSALRFRYIGPVGNRTIAVVGIPGDPNVYYVGAASGGVFKTTDGGASWAPIFDNQPVSSIGALAVAPSDLTSRRSSEEPHPRRQLC